MLTEWGLSASLIEDAELIISELVTNAVNTSVTLPDRPAITLRLIPGDQALLIEVWDRSPMPVHLENPGADDEHGRGLVVVAALSYRWGCDQDETDSKVVWAELAYR